MTGSAPPSILNEFLWSPQPEAEALYLRALSEFLAVHRGAKALADRMHSETGTRFQDWVDHLRIPAYPGLASELERAGYCPTSEPNCFDHPAGIFPRIVVDTRFAVAIKVDSIADFLSAQSLHLRIEGPPLNSIRQTLIGMEEGAELWAVERHGNRALRTEIASPHLRLASLEALEAFRHRPRNFASEAEGFQRAESLLKQSIDAIGVDWTCDLFFHAEREFWQRRNRAAQVQKHRQDRLGLGWANHDHHTYRSSRSSFVPLIQIFELLGFQFRERFTPGREAGWGAQIVEQKAAGITIFADVDMSPDELLADFVHLPMPARDSLGTVGLWCALHGEAFLQAGMHHLECQFDFDALRTQLASVGVPSMKPFTDFGFLRQAFTEGERWPVEENRLKALLATGKITPDQAARFAAEGALGSHLENLERNQGFKGFNQTGINEIIDGTNPLRH